jgi:uncharacterized protein (TIGR03084 family)
VSDDGLDALAADLAAEHADLDRVVADLAEATWNTPTPARGWAVRDQISHLAFFDEAARDAIEDPDAFTAALADVVADPESYVARAETRGRELSGEGVLDWWREARRALLAGLAGLDPSARLPWYGPPMGARSFVTARLMETWAHGQDVVDALGAERPPTDRLRHVAHLGVRTRGWSYAVRGEEAPGTEVHVELDAPSGATWTWGDAATPDRVRGSALDICLVVTQRRHVDDTDLVVEGDAAIEWMAIAQAFAGGVGEGREPGAFRARGSP